MREPALSSAHGGDALGVAQRPAGAVERGEDVLEAPRAHPVDLEHLRLRARRELLDGLDAGARQRRMHALRQAQALERGRRRRGGPRRQARPLALLPALALLRAPPGLAALA